jgi:hypothetical protein
MEEGSFKININIKSKLFYLLNPSGFSSSKLVAAEPESIE